jgi:hypothetical protein
VGTLAWESILLPSEEPAHRAHTNDAKERHMKNRRSASGLYFQLAVLAISSSLAAVAYAEVVGNTVGSAPSSGLSADFKRASKITLTVPATMTDL